MANIRKVKKSQIKKGFKLQFQNNNGEITKVTSKGFNFKNDAGKTSFETWEDFNRGGWYEVMSGAKSIYNENVLRQMIRDAIQELMEEPVDIEETTSVNGMAGGDSYQTPAAFVGKGGRARKDNWHKKTTGQLGWETVWDEDDADELEEDEDVRSNWVGKKSEKQMNENRRGAYQVYRDDGSKNTQQKIGESLKRMRSSLKELNKEINLNLRLKTESGIEGQAYWKRTKTDLNKITEHIHKLLEKIRRF